MKTTIKLLVVLALALATFGQHSSASAGYNYKFRGDTADAFFAHFDGVCTSTYVSVFATDGFNQSSPGPGATSSWTSIWIDQYDECNSQPLLGAYGETSLAGSDFQVSRKLGSARLTTTVNVYDWVSDSFFDVSIYLIWTGVGATSSGSGSSTYNSPGCKTHSRWRGTWRSAEVSGNVWSEAMNYTPYPFGGNISSVKQGDLAIGCN